MTFVHATPWSVVTATALSAVIFVAASSTTVFTMTTFAAFATVASSTASFAAIASSTTFAIVAYSFILALVAFSAATEASLAVEVDPLPSDPLGTIDAIALRSGRDVAATSRADCPDSRGPLTADPSLWSHLILLCRGASSSVDDTLVSLSTIRGATLPFNMPKPRPVLTPPWPLATSIPRIYTPIDSSPLYHAMTSMSSSMGCSLSSFIYVTWSEQIGTQTVRGVTKLVEDGSGLSLPSKVTSTFEAKSDPRPCLNGVVSLSLVYSHAGRARSWRGAMRLDRKSCTTIIDDKPWLIRCLILSIMGL
jgi:hypothetical protein